MDATRRLVLKLAAFLLSHATARGLAAQEGFGSRRLMVVLDGRGARMGAWATEALIRAFTGRGIPVAYAPDLGGAAPIPPGHAELLDRLASEEGGLFEIVLALRERAGAERYCQMREAASLRQALARALPGADPRVPVISLLDGGAGGPVDLAAYRSAGFHLLLRADGRGPMTTEPVGSEQIAISGGLALELRADVATIQVDAEGLLEEKGDVLLVLSLAGLDDEGAEAAMPQLEAVTERLQSVTFSGAAFLTRPVDYLLQSGMPFQERVALVMEAGGDEAEQGHVAAFAAELAGAGLPFTLVPRPGAADLPHDAELCRAWADPAAFGADCVLAEAVSELPAEAAATILLVPDDSAWAWNGLGPDARFRLTLTSAAPGGAIAAPAGPIGDRALRIAATELATPLGRSILLRTLVEAWQGGAVRFQTVSDLAAEVLAPDPLLSRLWSTRRRDVTDPPRQGHVVVAERDRLLEDAKLAWGYIEAFTDAGTGLCAGTVQGGANRIVNHETTMWDVGSQLQGIRAALRLGLIGADEARARARAVTTALPAVEIAGHALPPAVIAARDGAVVKPDFDICDTGRFLIALRMATEAGLLTAQDAAAVTGGWDLGAAVRDGRILNHTDGRWVDVTDSHCPLYIDPVLAGLGLSTTLPYPPLGRLEGGALSADDRMAVLGAAAWLGPYGTEPMLLQAVELGADLRSAYLTRVLFDAQLAWFEATGELKCVSEAPLNFEPWFTYQGFRPDRAGADAWAVSIRSSDPRFSTEEFRRRAQLISSKSAYLWAAVHPHDYSNRLVALIRDKGRIEGLGFSVGIFTATLEPMADYTDLNTNGIILEAIAALLA